MEQFEKWFKKIMVPRQNKGENIYKGDCEITWRAALKWAQNINKKTTEEYTDSQYGAIKQSIAIDVELRGD
ncbi:hypothetical protein LCGC14_0661480 [marine sediment metagenome]|uniref:Uncharacterized protein n=1 Tax=marine sediment metagenome TaxID=412755 RepID=A0A0F9QTE5_9ZZZZ